jgi:hypothetical protein
LDTDQDSSTPKWDWQTDETNVGPWFCFTGHWLAPVDPEHDPATEASISDWHLSCIVAFGGATVMEWIVLGFLLMHLLLLFGVFGGLLHTLFPRGCRNKSRGDRKGYSIQKAMPHGPDAALRKRGNQSLCLVDLGPATEAARGICRNGGQRKAVVTTLVSDVADAHFNLYGELAGQRAWADWAAKVSRVLPEKHTW